MFTMVTSSAICVPVSVTKLQRELRGRGAQVAITVDNGSTSSASEGFSDQA
jgi:hypothetical protein